MLQAGRNSDPRTLAFDRRFIVMEGSEEQAKLDPAGWSGWTTETGTPSNGIALDPPESEDDLQRHATASSHMTISSSRQTAVMVLITLTQLCQM